MKTEDVFEFIFSDQISSNKTLSEDDVDGKPDSFCGTPPQAGLISLHFFVVEKPKKTFPETVCQDKEDDGPYSSPIGKTKKQPQINLSMQTCYYPRDFSQFCLVMAFSRILGKYPVFVRSIV